MAKLSAFNTDKYSYEAVDITRNTVIVTDGGDIFPSYYSSTCGDISAVPSMLWGRDFYSNYFHQVSNFYKGAQLNSLSPHKRWKYNLSSRDLKKICNDLLVSYKDMVDSKLIYTGGLLAGFLLKRGRFIRANEEKHKDRLVTKKQVFARQKKVKTA